MKHIHYFCLKYRIMLRGAYSDITYFSKFVLLITLVLSFLLFSTLFGIVMLVPFYGSGVLGLLSAGDFTDASVIIAMKAMQIINMAGGLLLPGIIYLWLCTPGSSKYTGFSRSYAPPALALTVIMIIIAQPLIGWTSELNSYLTLPQGLAFIEDWMQHAERQGEQVTQAFLSTTSIGGLLLNVFMIAILPPLAEELLFRGVLARLFKDWSRNVHFAVFLSAFIFAAFHMQFYTFLPRFLLGAALGYLFFWSGSLWLPIAAHFANNFLTLIVEFLYRKGIITTNAENFGMDNAVWLIAFSIVGVTAVFYYIYHLSVGHKGEAGKNQLF